MLYKSNNLPTNIRSPSKWGATALGVAVSLGALGNPLETPWTATATFFDKVHHSQYSHLHCLLPHSLLFNLFKNTFLRARATA